MADMQGALKPDLRISDWTVLQYSTNRFFLRNYGLSAADLGINFSLVRPLLVTSLLELCAVAEGGKILDISFFWNLTVADRVKCLLIIAGIKSQSDITIPLLCNSCRKPMEVEISLDSLFGNILPDHFNVNIEGNIITLRRPRGKDLLEWLDMQFTDERSAIEALARSLVISNSKNKNLPELLETWFDSIDEALLENDPLVCFTITACCPECGCKNKYEIDLEDIALKKLRRVQQQMLYDIHKIAKCYHWNESEVLSIPQWRRAYYLELISREED